MPLSGNVVVLNWFYDEDDDTILEFGGRNRRRLCRLEFPSAGAGIKPYATPMQPGVRLHGCRRKPDMA